MPPITIGITCFNAKDTILSAIKSAQAQDWQFQEIIVVDDASTDGAAEVVSEYIKEHKNITLIRHPVNRGVAAARNTIIGAAKGDFIAFFDDDDFSTPDRIRTQYERIISYENDTGVKLLTCHASVRRHYENNYKPVFKAIGSEEKIPEGKDIVNYHLYLDRDPEVFYGGGTPCMTMMARTSTLKEIGGFDEMLRRNEDGEMSIRLGLAGGHVIGCKEVLIEQRSTGGADKRPQVSYESDLYIINKYKDVLLNNRRYTYAKIWARIKYLHYAGRRMEAIFCLIKLLLMHPFLASKQFMKRVPARLAHESRIRAE